MLNSTYNPPEFARVCPNNAKLGQADCVVLKERGAACRAVRNDEYAVQRVRLAAPTHAIHVCEHRGVGDGYDRARDLQQEIVCTLCMT